MLYIQYLQIYRRVLMASEQVLMSRLCVLMSRLTVPVASRQVLMRYECCPGKAGRMHGSEANTARNFSPSSDLPCQPRPAAISCGDDP